MSTTLREFHLQLVEKRVEGIPDDKQVIFAAAIQFAIEQHKLAYSPETGIEVLRRLYEVMIGKKDVSSFTKGSIHQIVAEYLDKEIKRLSGGG